ncbi:hypothetical protein [Herbiconiux liangxiaofengii]|uniref:hypothetical protein n=1 Tax=Herbiconiux liangxiaofengii TaxID=3342795 RepID=UPI0035B795D6
MGEGAQGVAADARGGVLPLHRRLRAELVTPESIYGTIIAAALIVVLEDDNDFDLLVSVGTTTFVFWIAHVFAFTVAHHGKSGTTEITLTDALGRALTHSSGLLLAAVPPMLVLGLGAAGVLDEGVAYLLSLAIGVIVLFLLGVMAFAEREAAWYARLAGGIVTALLGLAVIALKAVFH